MRCIAEWSKTNDLLLGGCFIRAVAVRKHGPWQPLMNEKGTHTMTKHTDGTGQFDQNEVSETESEGRTLTRRTLITKAWVAPVVMAMVMPKGKYAISEYRDENDGHGKFNKYKSSKKFGKGAGKKKMNRGRRSG